MALEVKYRPANTGDIRDTTSIPGWEDPLGKAWQPTPAFLPGKSQAQRSLAGYSPWSHKELAMTEVLSMHACFYLFFCFLKFLNN